MVLSSRDRRVSQRRDSLVRTIARAPPPAFLFPIQRCQRPRPAPPAPLFSAGGRRRRLSRGPPRFCQPDFSVFPRTSRSTRTARNGRHLNRSDACKLKKTKVFSSSSRRRPRPGRRLSRGPPHPRQPGFFSFFSEAPEEPENIRKRIEPQPLRHRQTQVIQGISSVRPGGDPSEEAAV